MPFQALFVLPAPDGVLQCFSGIVGEEITDVGIILKLLSDRTLRTFFCFQDPMVRGNGVTAGFPGVALQPLLELNVEGKAVSDLFPEKRAMFFRADKTVFNDAFTGDFGRSRSCLLPEAGRWFSRQKAAISSFR